MAHPQKTIHNRVTGQQLQFLQTSASTHGELLEMETTYPLHSKEPLPHYHPFQTEDFTVLSGEITVRMNEVVKVYQQGNTFHIPANVVHSMWNNANAPAVLNWKVQPAMNTEHFLETLTGLANEGKTNADGIPPVLQIARIANKYHAVFRLAKPSFAVQRVLFFLLTPIAWLSGYRAVYKKYLD
jgi:quercetin dioxygenase-like cupin family protein